MLITYHGNHFETLADQLADVLRTPAGSPLEPEWVVVQNGGMARWLSLRFAEHLGVCANVRFPLPASFILQNDFCVAAHHHEEPGTIGHHVLVGDFDFRIQHGFDARLVAPSSCERNALDPNVDPRL